ncbi:hypothetical protein [Paenibacillus sedimenti]|uniref:Uncharacterized protein n=1 Tax=Paenibacillus sedimenti TaxID=2770274 RepID=A0A926KP65_9BACL|nr:hypothetical protein [Paenibacillus sedimenti]MBD0381454.1 hypothetical protein [Paenibacillus sedimenti]
MSEFTSGHLLLAGHKEAIRKNAVPRSLIKVLDEKWIAYLTRNDSYLEYQEAPDYIYQLSYDAPVLNFCNLSDHFWGYRIFNGGQEVAYLRISYEFLEEIIIEIFKERYPEKEILELYGDMHEEISKEVIENGIFDEAIEHLFDESNVSAFKLFDISEKQIDKLKSILNPSYFREHKKIYQLVEEFKEIIGINEMSWIRHERVEEDEGYEEIF